MKRTKRILRGRSSRRRGATAVEFALVAPIIFLLFLGSIEMTNLNMISHTAANAAYEGARQSIVAGGTADDARAEVFRLLEIVRIHNGSEADVQMLADRVTVTVRIPVHLNSWGLSRFTGNLTVTRSCTLKRELVDHSLSL
jgi:Flp pilus assembly protein TadG